MGLLELHNVTLKLDDTPILDDLTLDLWAGHVHAVIGPNGAGKSTLAYTVVGLEGYRDIAGDIFFDGRRINDMPVTERARLGMTLGWQEPARYEGLTVETFLRASAGPENGDIDRYLDMVGLDPDEYRQRAVDTTLSGGERKKVELASILAMQPKLVILDEPDSGIDVASLENIFEAIKTLRHKGVTVMLITHSLAVLEQAEHAFLICCGKLIDKGSTDKIGHYFKDKCIPCDHKNEPDANGG
ncbi:MAG: ATP-binding cassette domain-containing protein [Armatimonadota bacterium]